MPVTDDLLLRIAYLENNPEAIPRAADQLDRMTESERALNEESKNLSENTDRVTGGFSKLQAGIVTLQSGIGLVKEGLGIVSGIIDSTVGKYAEYGRQVLLLSNNLGISAEETSRIIQTSDDFGISIDTVTSALQMMVRRGTAPSIEELAKIADQYVAIKDPIQRAALMTELLGRSWTSLTPLLKDGGDAIRDQAKAIATDLIITDADIQKTEALRKAKDELNDRVEALSLKLGNALTPAVTEGTDVLTKFVDIVTGNETAVQRANREHEYAISLYGMGSEMEKKYGAILQQEINLENQRAASLKVVTEVAMQQKTELEALTLVNQRYQESIQATDLSKLTPEKQQEAASTYQAYESKLTDIEIKGAEDRVKVIQDANDSIAKIEAAAGAKRAEIVSQFAADEASRLSDMRDKRIDILMSYSEAEQKITDSQNKERLKLAESYGIEVERAEQAHQLAMQRMSEDHGRNLRKLADSRDALGIEDEQENYRINRDRAEQDYQIQAAQRSEDYARQLADQNAAAEEQRQAARANQDKQLADLQETFTKQDKKYQDTYTKQLADLDKATSDQEKAVYDAQAKKLSDLQTAQDAERAQAADQWQQWRNEHEIFFAGEKALYDDYLKYTRDQLQAYLNGAGGTVPTVSGGTTPTGIPGAGRASGGSVSPFGVYRVGENGPENLYMGSQGGYVAPNMGGGMGPLSVVINVGGSNASPAEIKAAVIEGVTDLFQKAMRQ